MIAMLSHQDPVARLAALESLATMDHPARAAMLATALDDPLAQIRGHPRIRNRALNALGEIGGASVRLYLAQLVYDPDDTIRINAQAILPELDPAAVF